MSETPLPAELGFRLPAEWEPHAATWLAWPHEPSDWPGKISAIPWVFAEIVRALQDGERVRMIVQSSAQKRAAARTLALAGVDLTRVEFFAARTDRSWTRDFLPLFVARGRAKRRAVGSVKFRFNGWARYRNHRQDDRAGETVARWLGSICWRPEAAPPGRRPARVVLEGGAIDVDGEGTLIATEECLLNGPHPRNAALGKRGTERVLHDFLGVDAVLWLGRGIAGDDTTGHADDFARFVGPARVVVGSESNRNDPNHRVLAEARERLSGVRDARGRRIEVIRLPMPAPLHYGRQRLPASYANFYVGNQSVLVPTFNDPRDRQALGILAELFPGRQVRGIHCVDLVLGLGTLHCSTQQEPAGVPFKG